MFRVVKDRTPPPLPVGCTVCSSITTLFELLPMATDVPPHSEITDPERREDRVEIIAEQDGTEAICSFLPGVES